MIARWVALVLGLGGCAAGAGDRPDGSPVQWAHAVVSGDCAPWDGAATTIVLSDTPLDSNPAARPLLRFTIYRGTASVGGTRWAMGESKEGGGMAYWYPPSGDCTQVGNGWVELSAWSGEGPLRGRYRIRLPEDRVLTGEFAAAFDPRRVLCG